MRSMRLECQNKYFAYGPKSRLIRALLYAYTNKIVYDEILLRALFIVSVRFPVHTPVRTPIYGLSLSQSDQRISSVFQTVYNKYFLLFIIKRHCVYIITVLCSRTNAQIKIQNLLQIFLTFTVQIYTLHM